MIEASESGVPQSSIHSDISQFLHLVQPHWNRLGRPFYEVGCWGFSECVQDPRLSNWRGQCTSASIGGAVRSYSFAHESLVGCNQRPFDGLIGYSN
jgi:hypothetical protein